MTTPNTRRILGINHPCPTGTCRLPTTCHYTGRICTDTPTQTCTGCCTSCGGTGVGGPASAPETNGRCADCHRTGHNGPCNAPDLP